MRILSLVLALAALVLAFIAMQRVENLQAERPLPQAQASEGKYEVAVVMGRIQQYHQKWWAAGQTANAQLAAFYLHELEEAMEEVAEAKIMDDGIDVSQAMRTYGLPALAELERLLKEEGVQAMHAKGAIMTNACNACHQATQHEYIRLQEPSQLLFPDQVFTP
jgi:hypothetical protein